MLNEEQRAALVRVFERAQQLRFIGGNADISFEIEHSLKFGTAAFGQLFDPDGFAQLRCIDIGSGAGLPALVLAVAWPQPTWQLVDTSQKKCDFLFWAVSHLKMSQRVEVTNEAVERLGEKPDQSGSYDLLTSRAFGPVSKVIDVSPRFLKQNGYLLVSNPPEGSSALDIEQLSQSGFVQYGEIENISVFQKQ